MTTSLKATTTTWPHPMSTTSTAEKTAPSRTLPRLAAAMCNIRNENATVFVTVKCPWHSV